MAYVFPLSCGWENSSVTGGYPSYSSGKFHGGIDLVETNGGDPQVIAAIGGIVERVRHLTNSYGEHVVIAGTDGLYHFYCHMKAGSVQVSEGQQVAAGQVLGTMGATGNATGPHLHYEVRSTLNGTQQSSVVDPAPLLGITGTPNSPVTARTAAAPTNGNEQPITLQTVPYQDTEIQEAVAGSEEKGEYLFGRRCRVLIADETGYAVDVSDLHITFQIIKTYLSDLQYSVIDIYNVNRNTENFVISRGYQVMVEAGYTGSYYGQIFTGDIVQAYGFNENGTDFVLRIIAADNERFISEGFVCFNFLKGLTQRTAAENIVSKATIPTRLKGFSDNANEVTLPRGKVFFGMARDYLDQIAKTTNTTVLTQDGTISLVQISDPDPDRIFKLTPKTGLIGVPQQEDMGISGKCLLIPQIRVGRTVMVENQYIQQKQITVGSNASVSSIGAALGSSEVVAARSPTVAYTGLELIKRYEGCELTAYQDSGGVWTIGYGHTAGVHSSMTITQEQAEQLLAEDLMEFAGYVDNTYYVPFTAELNENQRDALISFAFNCGQGSLKQLCQGRTVEEIAEHMLNYTKDASGNRLAGLVRRRRAEYDLYNTPVGDIPYSDTEDQPETQTGQTDAVSVSPLDRHAVYRIAKVKYNGDTRGDAWYIEFEAMTQTGYVPALLTDESGQAF
jgi:GH24 family phage-related lysozyme (muramidase)